ncbi:hypothetical protein [Pseudomonas sp. Marseille-Q1929]|uniref:hypothetical protein n=1 Tax=Pseudomonas sp. Marseille-Q1929 TaxID=2730402 RepID=UPI001A8CEE51|nr:hypothetical protein [Pseudomonas sp. Marseille-Q1929]MBO0494755.1 hypothetical protein [Pseudomonas sp. Marseille-Q1929]
MANIQRIELDQLAEQLHSLIRKAWPVSNQIWVDTHMSDRYLLLVSGQQAYEISVTDFVPVTRADVDAAPPHPHADGGRGALRFVWWKGRQAIAFDVPLYLPLPPDRFPPLLSDAQEIYLFVVHEIFHLIQFSEQRWTPPQRTFLAKEYPVPTNPWLYRTMLYHALQRCASPPSQAYLAEAAYWHGLYVSQFPETAKNLKYYDVIEGSAQFFQAQIHAAALIDNPADNEARRAKAAELSYPVSPAMQQWLLQNVNGSYWIGEAAGAALDVGDNHWRADVAAGQSPMDILSSTIDPPALPPVPEAEIVRENTALIAELNRVIAVQLEPVIQGFLDKNHVLLLLSNWWEMAIDPSKEEEIAEARKNTVLVTTGNFVSAAVPYALWGSWVGAYLLENGNFVIKNLSALQGNIQTKDQMIIPLNPAAPGFDLNDGVLTLSTENMYGTLAVEVIVDDDGRTLLVAS